MSHNNASSDDSDSSLPDPSHLFPSLSGSSTTADCPLSSGDIVYAKFKKLYWPALVRTVYPSEKKVSIWYCDDPGKTFKLPLKNVCSFSDSEVRSKIEKDVKEAGCFQSHQGLTAHAERYLRRKVEGYKDDLMKFFDQTYPYLLIEKVLKTNSSDVSDLKIPPLYLSHEQKTPIKKRSAVLNEESDDSEVVLTDDEEISESVNSIRTPVSYVMETPYLPTDEYTDKIIECVLSGKVDTYLQNILLKIVNSEFQNIYEQAALCGKRDFESVSFSGPIENIDKIHKLTSYLLTLVDSVIAVCNADELHKSIISFFQDKTDIAHYVASVWLPESIIYAMSEIQNVSMSEAKYLFNEYSKSYQIKIISASQDQIHQRTMNAMSSKTIESNTRELNSEVNKHSLETICSPLKKLCVSQIESNPRKNIFSIAEYASGSSCDIKYTVMNENTISKPIYQVKSNEIIKVAEDYSLKSPNKKTLSNKVNKTVRRQILTCNDTTTKTVPNNRRTINQVERCKLERITEVPGLNSDAVSPGKSCKRSRSPVKCSNTKTKIMTGFKDNNYEGNKEDKVTKHFSLKYDTLSPRKICTRSANASKSDKVAKVTKREVHKLNREIHEVMKTSKRDDVFMARTALDICQTGAINEHCKSDKIIEISSLNSDALSHGNSPKKGRSPIKSKSNAKTKKIAEHNKVDKTVKEFKCKTPSPRRMSARITRSSSKK